MKKPFDQSQHMALIAEAAVNHHRAEILRNALRRELNAMYSTYFAAHGRPYSDDRRINRLDPAFDEVIQFTNQAYLRWLTQRDHTTRLKSKLRNLVRRLERAQ